MGNWFASPPIPPSPPSSPIQPRKPWITGIVWDTTQREELISYIDNYTPPFNHPTTNILIVGVAGSGKSSYINTLISAVRRQVTSGAAARESGKSVTKHIRRYGNILHNIDLCDTIGVPISHGKMEKLEELMLKGKMPSQSKETNTEGVVEDIHGGLIVVQQAHLEKDRNIDMIKINIGKVQDMFEEKEIPYMMLITKVDELNDSYVQSAEQIFYDTRIEELVDRANVAFGVPHNRIWPIVNYENVVVNQSGMDILALSVLQMILRAAEVYIEVKHLFPSTSD